MFDSTTFKDRKEAGSLVAEKLMRYADREDVIVLALPRGGVVNGFEIARQLKCPLDILIVRKIGFPGQPELAIGAVAETGVVVLNEEVISFGRVSEEYIKQETEKQKEEIKRRMELYRSGKGLPELEDKTVILVDDGVATGATMKAAIAALKKEKLKKLVVGLPVASVEAEASIGKMVDEMVCLQTPLGFMAVGGYYEDFTQVTDDEVVEMLKRSKND
jgi:putative phosphoribosyl transferase